jgi:Zn-dependent protease with chaperone function
MPLWAFTVAIAMVGARVGTMPMERELFPAASRQLLLRGTVRGFILRFLHWIALIGTMLLMPDHFSGLAWAIGGAVAAFWLGWTRGLSVMLWKRLRWFEPAPERLRQIVADTSARMGLLCLEVLMSQSPQARAGALINIRQLLFTDRLLAICPDEEVAAICAHELGHLTEPRSVRIARTIQSLAFLPWIFIKPLLHLFSDGAVFGLMAFTWLVPIFSRPMSRKLEVRADQIAKANESDAGVYARALTRLYEASQTPAVNRGTDATHPHLYDRILAAGVTPEFSRPEPPSEMATHGKIAFALLGALIMACAIQMQLQ